MKLIFRILIRAPVLLAGLLLQTAGALVGFVVIPILLAFKAYRYRETKVYTDGRMVLSFPDWAWIWNNEEDGVDGIAQTATMRRPFKNDAWNVKMSKATPRTRIWQWAALRNPANNLRFTWPIRLKINPAKLHYRVFGPLDQYKGINGWFIWQGLKSGLRLDYKQWRFWIGWKIKPFDAGGIEKTDYRYPGAGLAIQFKRGKP